jgi:hypothetical protein
MILPNPTDDQLNRQAGTWNREHLNLDEFPGSEALDWLFFTELNANEVPGKKVLELEE